MILKIKSNHRQKNGFEIKVKIMILIFKIKIMPNSEHTGATER